MSDCAVCGRRVAQTDAFCGSCGSRLDRDVDVGAPPEGGSSPSTLVADASWTGFQLTSEPDDVAEAAARAIEEDLDRHGLGARRPNARYCTILYSDYVGVQADTGYAGKSSALVGASLYRAMSTLGQGRGPHGDYDVNASHYAFRMIEWGKGELGAMGMSTYAAALFSMKPRAGLGGGRVEYQTLPPSPLSNTIFAVLPGVCAGPVVMSRESGGFVAREASLQQSWLIQRLNDPAVTRDVAPLLAQDRDVVGAVAFQREYVVPVQGVAKRPLGPRRGTDPYFLPTLFESEEYDYRNWPGYSANPSRRLGRGPGSTSFQRRMEGSLMTTRDFDPSKYFAVALLPFARGTLVALTWPTPSRFDPRGRLEAVDLSLTRVERVLEHLLVILGDSRTWGETAPPALAYWELANRTAQYRGIKTRQFNFPIPPLEWVLGSLPAD